MSGNFLMINGKILHVINARKEVVDQDRIRWGIVTEELEPAEVMRMMYETIPGMPPVAPAPAEVQPAAPADATAGKCAKCGAVFDATDQSYGGTAPFPATPFCRGCIAMCHDTEIADHWCAVDEWREQDRKRAAGARHSIEDCPGGESCPGHAQELFRNSGPAAPPVPRLDGPPVYAARVPGTDTNRCAECVTAHSCEEQGRCLFEGRE